MSLPPRPLVYSAVIALATVLAACSTPGNYRNDTAHAQLLQALRQCLVDVSISTDKSFVSPCVGRDVSSLNGISRGQLMDVLGPARLCVTTTETNFPEKDKCPGDQSPLWSFYRRSGSIDIGGGPELICLSDKQGGCTTVEWRRTK